MSLVSEALRKARQEAAAKGANQHGMIFRTTVVLGSEAARPFLGWIVLGIVALSALAGAGVAWWLVARHGAERESAATGARPIAAASPAPVVTSQGPPSAPVQAAAPVAPEPEAVRPAATRAPAPIAAAAPESADVRPSDVAAGAPAPAAVATEARPEAAEPRLARPPAERAGAGERSFVLDADLGRVKLHLDFIVYRPKSPFASINGQEVVVGSAIEGFTVEEIDADAVHLRDGRGPLVLRTH